MDYRGRIRIEPGGRSGQPCIRGLRMTVSGVLDSLAGGMTEDEILADFPDLERDDIRAALALAADLTRRPDAAGLILPAAAFDAAWPWRASVSMGCTRQDRFRRPSTFARRRSGKRRLPND